MGHWAIGHGNQSVAGQGFAIALVVESFSEVQQLEEFDDVKCAASAQEQICSRLRRAFRSSESGTSWVIVDGLRDSRGAFRAVKFLPHAGIAAVLEVAPGQGNVTVF